MISHEAMGVFLNALPKSGTNLVAKALELMGFTQRPRLASDIVLSGSLTARARRLLSRTRAPGYLVGIDTPVEVARPFVDARLRATRPGTFTEAHVGYTADVLDAVRRSGLAAIVVIRDPRAVLNSFAHYVRSERRHILHRHFRGLPRETQYEVALKGGMVGRHFLQPLAVRCRALTPWLRAHDVLRLKFGDIVGPKGGGSAHRQHHALTRLAAHVGADAAVSHVAAHLFGPGRSTFRSGRVDSWREEIPPRVQKLLTPMLGDILDAWGIAE